MAVPTYFSKIEWGTNQQFTTNTGTSNVNYLGGNNSDTIIVAYRDATDGDSKIVAGLVSGTSISWGTPVQFGTTTFEFASITHGTVDNNYLLTYDNNADNISYGRGFTVSGNTITLGVAVSLGGNYLQTESKTSYNPDNNNFLVPYRRDANFHRGKIATISGTTVSFGTEFTIQNISGATTIFSEYDQNANCYIAIGTYTGQINATYISGTGIVGNTALDGNEDNGTLATCYDHVSGNVVYTGNDSDVSGNGRVYRVTVSGTTPTIQTRGDSNFSVFMPSFIGRLATQDILVIGRGTTGYLLYDIDFSATSFVGVTNQGGGGSTSLAGVARHFQHCIVGDKIIEVNNSTPWNNVRVGEVKELFSSAVGGGSLIVGII